MSIKTEVLGQDFPRERQKNNIKVFSLTFGNEEMTDWQDYLGVRHQTTMKKAGNFKRENEQAFELSIKWPQDRTLHFVTAFEMWG